MCLYNPQRNGATSVRQRLCHPGKNFALTNGCRTCCLYRARHRNLSKFWTIGALATSLLRVLLARSPGKRAWCFSKRLESSARTSCELGRDKRCRFPVPTAQPMTVRACCNVCHRSWTAYVAHSKFISQQCFPLPPRIVC